MTIDPMASLSFAVYSQKGVYALLLGSGISRNAQIKTGWEITLDLVSQLAAASRTPTKDPEEWYRGTFKKEPDYAEVLDLLSKTNSERQRILSQFFEASETEKQTNPQAKQPTAAHRAIAKLVSKGYIRVVLTTNFDRLMERALEDEGVAPHVIVGDDGIKGRMPFAHAEPTVIKLHGDYKDTRLLNTPVELETYSKPLQKLLNEVVDTFGLITCGWSASYDKALERAIKGSPSRRFSTFWTYRGNLSAEAESIIKSRSAVAQKISGADEFFVDLLERVEAMETMNQEDLLSPKIAVARVKTYLQEPKRPISLHDLLLKEASKVVDASLAVARARSFDKSPPDKKLEDLRKIENLSQSLLHMCAATAYWDDTAARGSLRDVLERLAAMHAVVFVNVFSADLKLYPALLAFYACGVSAVLRRDYHALRAYAHEATFKTAREKDDKPLVYEINTAQILGRSSMKDVGPEGNQRSPISWYIFDALKDCFAELHVNETDYSRAFDEFEILISAQFDYLLQMIRNRPGSHWFSFGKFCTHEGWDKVERMLTSIEKEQGNWAPFRAKLFGNNLDEVKAIFKELLSMQDQWWS